MNTIFGTKTHFKFVVTYKNSRCLKITEKVAFNIASEASYVYIFSGQKLIKNAKNGQFWRVFENLTKIGEKYQDCDTLSSFQTQW